MNKKLIQSPLNYTGGKYKLLPQILPHFPKDIKIFLDLFAGGCSVGININSDKVIFNDISSNLINLFNTFKNVDEDYLLNYIYNCINKYNLSNSSKNGYSYYNCKSDKGLANYNREGFLELREVLNNNIKNNSNEYNILLYVLIVYAFNNQIRFNKKGEFNLPVGKRDFNSKMKNKLLKFIKRLHEGNYSFINKDFEEINIDQIEEGTFIYIDPPYLITCATYNENGGWTKEKECNLLSYLDKLHCKGFKFALSNILESKGKKNDILISWLNRNKNKYKEIALNYNYSNSNYQTKYKSNPSKEVLIVNY